MPHTYILYMRSNVGTTMITETQHEHKTENQESKPANEIQFSKEGSNSTQHKHSTKLTYNTTTQIQIGEQQRNN